MFVFAGLVSFTCSILYHPPRVWCVFSAAVLCTAGQMWRGTSSKPVRLTSEALTWHSDGFGVFRVISVELGFWGTLHGEMRLRRDLSLPFICKAKNGTKFSVLMMNNTPKIQCLNVPERSHRSMILKGSSILRVVAIQVTWYNGYMATSQIALSQKYNYTIARFLQCI